jgi:protein SCO1/2
MARRQRLGPALVLLAVLLATGGAGAHDQDKHPKTTVESQGPPALPAAFAFDVGGPFALIDHRGQDVTDQDYRGAYLLVFFGYASCENICPVALGRMAAALDRLGPAGDDIQPLLITVDPKNDDVEALAAYVPKVHPRLVGLTGSAEALQATAEAYHVESRKVGTAWDGGPIFSHGSFVYLMGRDGQFLTLLPPVMDAQTMATTIRRYL